MNFRYRDPLVRSAKRPALSRAATRTWDFGSAACCADGLRPRKTWQLLQRLRRSCLEHLAAAQPRGIFFASPRAQPIGTAGGGAEVRVSMGAALPGKQSSLFTFFDSERQTQLALSGLRRVRVAWSQLPQWMQSRFQSREQQRALSQYRER